MFSEETIDLFYRYQNGDCQKLITKICTYIKGIEDQLKELQISLSKKIYEINTSDALNIDDLKIISDDIICIKKERIALQQLFDNLKIKEENIPINYDWNKPEPISTFTGKVYPYLISEPVCPICKKGLFPQSIYYQQRTEQGIISKSINGYKCYTCSKIFIVDSNSYNINLQETNIDLNMKFYNKLTYNDVIVIHNIRKCVSHNHKTEDIICNMPIIKTNGDIVFTTVPVIHCKSCRRYIVLKSNYDELDGIPICVVNDETHVKTRLTEGDFSHGDTSSSKLYQHGYNVNCVDNLTEQQRHKILLLQLLSNNMTRGEIVSTLDGHINNGLKRKDSKHDWSKAVVKWKNDREFVEKINLEQAHEKIDIGRFVLKYNNKNQ